MVRGHKVMLDSDLANLYQVSTKRLNEAVKRNTKRFPATFMFRLTAEENEGLRSQTATSNIVAAQNGGRGGRRYLPYAFTEHGVVMLSSVLNSDRAVEMSILVVNAFVRMRELIASNKDLANRVEKLEQSQDRTASVIEILVEDIDRIGSTLQQMQALPTPPRKSKIGFRQ